MYRITCPSRTRLNARSQVLARNRCLMYRVTGHYPDRFADHSWYPEMEQQLTPISTQHIQPCLEADP